MVHSSSSSSRSHEEVTNISEKIIITPLQFVKEEEEDDVPVSIPPKFEIGVDDDTSFENQHHDIISTTTNLKPLIQNQFLSKDVVHQTTTPIFMICLCVSVMSMGALNNVFGKIRAKPMGDCSYFEAILNAGVYCIFYTSILVFRVRQGIIPTQQLHYVITPYYSLWQNRIGNPSRMNIPMESSNSDLHQPFLLSRTAQTSHHISSSQMPLLTSPITTITTRMRDHFIYLSNHISYFWNRFRSLWTYLGPWKYFFLAGICDALGNALGFIAQPFVPGPLFALMNQATLPMVTILSVVLLRKRYTLWQTMAIIFVLIGGIISLLPNLIDTGRGEKLAAITLKYSLITVLGTLPTALSSALKEKIFRSYTYRQHQRALFIDQQQHYQNGITTNSLPIIDTIEFKKEQHTYQNKTSSIQSNNHSTTTTTTDSSSSSSSFRNEQPLQESNTNTTLPMSLDIFVVATLGSWFQLLSIPFLLRTVLIFSEFRDIGIQSFLSTAFACILGKRDQAELCHACLKHVVKGPDGDCNYYGCCQWAFATYIPYIIVNITFNILFLILIVRASAVVAFMTLKAVLPLAVILFAFIHWPLLNAGDTEVSPLVLAGLVTVCTSIIWYRQASVAAAIAKTTNHDASAETAETVVPSNQVLR